MTTRAKARDTFRRSGAAQKANESFLVGVAYRERLDDGWTITAPVYVVSATTKGAAADRASRESGTMYTTVTGTVAQPEFQRVLLIVNANAPGLYTAPLPTEVPIKSPAGAFYL